MTPNEILIFNVTRLSRGKGWTHRQLASHMGINEASLSRAINHNPSLRTLGKIAKALDVSIKSLFQDPNDVEGFILLQGRAYHFNNKKELDDIERYAQSLPSPKLKV